MGHLVLFICVSLTLAFVNGQIHRRNTTNVDVTCGTSIPLRTTNYPGQYPVRHL